MIEIDSDRMKHQFCALKKPCLIQSALPWAPLSRLPQARSAWLLLSVPAANIFTSFCPGKRSIRVNILNFWIDSNYWIQALAKSYRQFVVDVAEYVDSFQVSGVRISHLSLLTPET
jgi:hypothetical protein